MDRSQSTRTPDDKRTEHISCTITRNVLFTFLACARLAINVSFYRQLLPSVDNLCKPFGPRSAFDFDLYDTQGELRG